MKYKKKTSQTYLQVSDKSIIPFEERMRQLLLSSKSTTFTKIINTLIISFICLMIYFRETTIYTQKLLDILVTYKNQIQTRVKILLNSKMPYKFPFVVFYTPKELWRLRIISMCYVLIPQNDFK